MRVVCYLVIIFYAVTCGASRVPHGSVLVSVTNQAAVPQGVGNLIGREFYSTPYDQCGCCYGTHGEVVDTVAENLRRNEPIPKVVRRPRCHSEVSLLFEIGRTVGRDNADVLNGCRVEIKNSAYFPCRTECGRSYYGKTEYNPGVPCHSLLMTCSQAGGDFYNFFGFWCASILVRFPGGNVKAIEYPGGVEKK